LKGGQAARAGTLLTSEFTVLTRLLARIASDITPPATIPRQPAAGARTLCAALSVYRTYLTPSGPSAHDRELISGTIERRAPTGLPPMTAIFDFLAIR